MFQETKVRPGKDLGVARGYSARADGAGDADNKGKVVGLPQALRQLARCSERSRLIVGVLAIQESKKKRQENLKKGDPRRAAQHGRTVRSTQHSNRVQRLELR
ncbi:hypothetical protein BDDG_04258 [Blastomyces dermatitidis ATCC 18188]|uniref:Uncharacterized protein n=1 Tax=Ajellomyces dermatitidis (strain ATCC 18188 / CBS 674.68) TaxID=653446 RepID=F2TDK4_AJEDA|nr:hypothetical protein BDDG_04258 [Blastomyces dermatitidis ATCC 18188]EQL36975.1 hypothetical protein BDFG_01602 [Blastomyces dermatitidis ATCC 26199]